VIQAPSALDPRSNPERAIARRDYVLRQMHDGGVLSDEELEAALAEELTVVDRVVEERTYSWIAHAFSRALDNYVGEDRAVRGNLVIETTIDPELQDMIDSMARSYLADYDGFHAAGLADLSDGLTEADWATARDVLPRLPTGWQPAIVIGEVSADRLPLALPDGSAIALWTTTQDWEAEAIAEAVELGAIVALSPSATADKTEESVAVPLETLAEGTVDDGQAAIEDGLKLAGGAGADPIDSPYAEAPIDQVTSDWRLETITDRQIAVVLMDPRDGNVRAVVGGYHPGLSDFDRSHSIRQPGSSIKPLLFLTALDEGMAHDQLVLDLPIEVQTVDGLWTPANYGGEFVGTVPMYRALELSINLVAARLAYELGVETFADMAEAAGAYPTNGMEQVLSAALGSIGTTPMRMAGAYGTIANGGYRITPTMAARIVDPITGEVVWQPTPGWGLPPAEDAEPIAEPEAVETLISMMRGVTTRGTAAGSFAAFEHPVAGKTGTSQDFRDAWFIGYTPEMVVAVWVGRDDNRPMGYGNAGGDVAAPLAADIFAALYDNGWITEDGSYTLLAGGGETGTAADDDSRESGSSQFTGTGGLY
jgi:penicillin-binding protein 1A